MHSVLTLVHGRPSHLTNLVRGLSQSDRWPDELVIVYMNEREAYPLPEVPFPVRTHHVWSDATTIPLAAARNQAVALAQHEWLIFLDVDCIPAPDLLTVYQQQLGSFPGLLMGDIRYLPAGTPVAGTPVAGTPVAGTPVAGTPVAGTPVAGTPVAGTPVAGTPVAGTPVAGTPVAASEGSAQSIQYISWDIDTLRAQGVKHPRRPDITQPCQPTSSYELFWSLNFALSRSCFHQIGGFDTDYQGYGAEDTDFAFTARKHRIPFALVPALAFHQHHPTYQPPLQHFEDIIVNAQRFYHKWNVWPMEGWLRAFTNMELIAWHAQASHIEVVRSPNRSEVAQARHQAPAGF